VPHAVEGQKAWDGVIELTSFTVDAAGPTGLGEGSADDDA
jgi:hypothetical protein